MSQERRFLAIANPCGGARRGLSMARQMKALFAAGGAELEIRPTAYAGHAQELLRSVNLEHYQGICVIGGDGTTHEVIGALMQLADPSQLPLGLIPAGTGNTLHHNVGCGDPQEAARRILRGETQSLDVVRVQLAGETVHCANIIGWGAVADINRRAERLRLLRASRYAAATLVQVFLPKPRQATVQLDDERIEGELLFVLACNTRTTGAGMLVAPDAKLDDGLLDVLILRNTTRWQTLKMFRHVFHGTHLSLPGIEYRQVRSLSIQTDAPDPLNLDGENKGASPLTAHVLPGALRVFC